MIGEKKKVTYPMTYFQATATERRLRKLMPPSEDVIIDMVRKPSQLLRKSSIPPKARFYTENERRHLISSLEKMEFSGARLDKLGFHCLLVIELLACNPLTDCFKHKIDPKELSLPAGKMQLAPLDLTFIAYKILRGDYEDQKGFERDISKMFHHLKLVYLNSADMIAAVISLENYFWEISSITSHFKAGLRVYQQMQRLPRKSRVFRNTRDYTLEERRELNVKIKSQSLYVQAQIRQLIIERCPEMIKNGEAKVGDIPKKVLNEIEDMLQNEAQQNKQCMPFEIPDIRKIIEDMSVDAAIGSDSDD